MLQNQNIAVAIDIAVFKIENDQLKILLIKRKSPPYKDSWALPGGFVSPKESLQDAAQRELFEETNLQNLSLSELHTFSLPKRDPRGRVISIAYLGLINTSNKPIANSDAKQALFFPIKKLPKLAFDHKEIIDFAVSSLKKKSDNISLISQLLPKKFRLTQLQKACELTSGQKIDKRNFRKKILNSGILKETKEMLEKVKHRPAKLYSIIK